MNFMLERMHFLALNIGCCEHDADWNWKDVRSPFSRLYYVTEGKAKIVLPSGTYDLRPGHFYFIPAYIQHSCICDSKFTHYYLHLFEDHQQGPSVLEEIDIPTEVECQDESIVVLFKRLCQIESILKDTSIGSGFLRQPSDDCKQLQTSDKASISRESRDHGHSISDTLPRIQTLTGQGQDQ